MKNIIYCICGCLKKDHKTYFNKECQLCNCREFQKSICPQCNSDQYRYIDSGMSEEWWCENCDYYQAYGL